MNNSELASLLPLPVVIPLVAAVLAPLIARASAKAALIVAMVAMGGSTAVLLLFVPHAYTGRLLAHYLGNWGPVNGTVLGVTFMADPFGLTFALLSGLVGLVLLLSSLSQFGGLGRKEIGGYTCLFLLLLTALIAAGLTADTIDLFVWFEVAALSSYGLTAFFLERPPALEAAIKMMVLTNLAAFCVFVGAAMLYSKYGALSFGQLHQALRSSAHGGTLPLVAMVALGLLVAGFAVKAGLMPFHGWLADAQMVAPGPVSALFAGLMDNLGIVCIARLALDVYDTTGGAVLAWFAAIGAVSAVLGAVLALAQDDLKRLLAYDTISQMGVLAVGIGSGSESGTAGAVYHMIAHGLFKTLLFLCAGAIVHATGYTKLSQLGGLARRRPILAGGFLMGTMAIAGVPPMNGYVSLGLIHDALLEGHPVLYGTMLVAQVITIAALARATYLAFFRRRARDYDTLKRPDAGISTAFGVLAAGCVVFGIVPGFVLDHIAGPAASTLIAGDVYARAALTGAATQPAPTSTFDYFAPTELATMAVTVAVGLALAAWYVRRQREPLPVRALRRIHTGSVNDYAGFVAVGLVLTLAVLLWH